MSSIRILWPALILLALLAVPAQAAESGHPGHKSSGACARSKRNTPSGAITYSDWQFPPTLNTDQTALSAAYVTSELQNDSLVRYDSHGRLYPVLLTTVPTQTNGGISKDGKTIYLHLKHGLHWSNGATITAHQIWFAWKIGLDPLSGPACLGTCDKIASISTPGAYDAVLHMRTVYASAVPRALPGIMIESWHNAVDGWTRNNYHQAANALYQNPQFDFTGPAYPTTGPYRVTDFKPNDHITLRPNVAYTDMSCGARLSKITFHWYAKKSDMIAAAAGRRTDITLDYHPADLAALRASAGPYKVFDTPSFVYEHLELNVDHRYGGKTNPLSSQKVRLAMALAVDKLAIARRSLGISASDARRIMANNPWVWRPGLKQAFADTSITGQWDPIAGKYVRAGSAPALRDARRLLKSTPWKQGFSLDAVTTPLPVRQKMLNQVAAAWSRLGIRVTVSTVPDEALFGTWEENGTLAHGRFQMALFSWVGSPDPDSWVDEMGTSYVDRNRSVHSDLNQNYAGITDGIIDRGFKQGASTYNVRKRAAAYHAVQRELNHQAYWIGLYYRDQISTSDGRVKHFAPNPTTAGVAWNAYNWTT